MYCSDWLSASHLFIPGRMDSVPLEVHEVKNRDRLIPCGKLENCYQKNVWILGGINSARNILSAKESPLRELQSI